MYDQQGKLLITSTCKKYPSRRSKLIIKLAIVSLFSFQSFAVDSKELVELSFEELGNIQVTSVSKRSESINEAAASIFVITNKDIQRSGAASLPEALRLAPNLQVAQDNARNYAITARGFNTSVFANKLLVLIDGRTIYTPLYSGVFWDAQDVVLEDIERIEVISGAGATLWGANAVNGIINIITKNASQTQGGLVSISGSDNEQYTALRYGGTLNNGGSYRVYAKHAEHEDTHQELNNKSLEDGLRRDKVGFRSDWETGNDKFTFQGDFYNGYLHELTARDIQISGANVLARANTLLPNGSNLSIQGYVDYTFRDQANAFKENLTTTDIEIKHDWKITERHNLIWGGGYRIGFDRIDNDNNFAFLPEQKNLHWANVFAQDEISLTDSLRLTLGLKLEHNSYTGMESLPNARLGWKFADNQFAWASASRSVRAPSRFDTDLFAPTVAPFILAGGPNYESEIANTYEIGYRATPTPKTSVSVTGFYTEYDKLRTLEFSPGFPLIFENNASGRAHGVEMWGSWQTTEKLKLSGGLVIQEVEINRPVGEQSRIFSLNSNDPSSHSLLRVSYDITPNHLLDVTIRHVNKLPRPQVPAYTALDLRYGWKINKDLEFSIVGQNLLDPEHAEFSRASTRPDYDRSLFAKVQWNFR
ncbi:MAG TPA: TonB-dependent receptor [Methylotenera sp.]|nr:TonB-dependent receptor [Methylotenera sp.]